MNTAKSLFQRAADDGLFMGILLTVIFLFSVWSAYVSVLSLFIPIFLIGIPVLNYILIRRTYVKYQSKLSFSTYWLSGILMFLFASLICGIVTFVYLKYVDPTFIYTQTIKSIQAWESIPEFKDSQFISVMKEAIDRKMLPTPIQFVFQMLWFTTFIGSILSLAIAGLVRLFPIKK